MKRSTIIRRNGILNIRCIVTGNKPKTYEIKQARWFKDRNSNELLYIANYKALDCLLGNRCFCFFFVRNINIERHGKCFTEIHNS